jgi:hypothetical protein
VEGGWYLVAEKWPYKRSVGTGFGRDSQSAMSRALCAGGSDGRKKGFRLGSVWDSLPNPAGKYSLQRMCQRISEFSDLINHFSLSRCDNEICIFHAAYAKGTFASLRCIKIDRCIILQQAAVFF